MGMGFNGSDITSNVVSVFTVSVTRSLNHYGLDYHFRAFEASGKVAKVVATIHDSKHISPGPEEWEDDSTGGIFEVQWAFQFSSTILLND